MVCLCTHVLCVFYVLGLRAYLAACVLYKFGVLKCLACFIKCLKLMKCFFEVFDRVALENRELMSLGLLVSLLKSDQL